MQNFSPFWQFLPIFAILSWILISRCASISWFQFFTNWVTHLFLTASASTGLSEFFYLLCITGRYWRPCRALLSTSLAAESVQGRKRKCEGHGQDIKWEIQINRAKNYRWKFHLLLNPIPALFMWNLTRHFQQAIQDGQAIKEEVLYKYKLNPTHSRKVWNCKFQVETHDDAVLFLWKVHNKVKINLVVSLAKIRFECTL